MAKKKGPMFKILLLVSSSFNNTGATEECDEGEEAHQIQTEGIFCLQHYEILNEMERSINSVMSPVL